MSNIDPNDFLVLYPGVYCEKEKALVEQYIADNKAIEARGEIDVQALINGTLPKDTPGIGPVVPVTEAMVRYNNEKYDPENPLLNDAEYAKKMGFQDILSFPCFGAHDDSFMVPWPPDARDTLCVSQLNHEVRIYGNVYPGDTLYMVFNKRTVVDRTPVEGSIYRHITLTTEGSVYNQKGEKVNDVIFRVCESLKIYKDEKRPEEMGFEIFWEAPDWLSRPQHYYTDKDWDFIKDIWSKEKRQGATPLYWDDVKVGDEPTWTCDGPILESLGPTQPYGLGTGGSRTIRKEIMDPELCKGLIRGEKDGLYRFPKREDYIPAVPDGAVSDLAGTEADVSVSDAAIDTADIHKQGENRAALINFLGRELAFRHIWNYVGDHGFVTDVRWGIMPQETHAALGKVVPKNPEVDDFLQKVSYMKDKTVNAHGMSEDLALIKSYVYDKYVKDDDCLIDVAWWIETIVGDIWLAGGFTVKLPKKK